MTKTLVSVFALAGSLLATMWSGDARADIVSDRVLLVTGGGGCPSGEMSFRRIQQRPDGSQTAETSEYQVPYGSYLEVTSIEYTTPYSTPWAQWLYQVVDVSIHQRSGTASTLVLDARYQNSTLYGKEADLSYSEIGEAASPGAETHVASFPVGPLMGSAGRLCVSAANNFWLFGGSIRVRGHLLPSGEPPIVTGLQSSL